MENVVNGYQRILDRKDIKTFTITLVKSMSGISFSLFIGTSGLEPYIREHYPVLFVIYNQTGL